VTLTLLGRAYCHLCDDMLAALAPFRARWGFELESVDVDADIELDRRFGERVPVLFSGPIGEGREICHYFLDPARLAAELESAAADPVK
jgi:hypothetical protein